VRVGRGSLAFACTQMRGDTIVWPELTQIGVKKKGSKSASFCYELVCNSASPINIRILEPVKLHRKINYLGSQKNYFDWTWGKNIIISCGQIA
jgi:hypothetical protein